jgi:glycosyltransferase involved in cell wall biosynthesis
MKLSVLMSVYHRESPEFLRQSLDSLAAQTIQADEVVVVKDGPLGNELDTAIDSYAGKLPIVVLQLKNNVRLGLALQAGLSQCRGELVARMDTDDICLPERFEKQLTFLERNPEVDVVGGAIAEFDTDWTKIDAIRRMPCDAELVDRIARRRNPLNHMTVMFRKASVIAAGNYQNCNGPMVSLEDYDLWARMLMQGARIRNLEDVLVYARIGNSMLQRRGGFRYLQEEARLQYRFMKMGFLSKGQFVLNLVSRAPVRLAPVSLRAAVYRRVLRQN